MHWLREKKKQPEDWIQQVGNKTKQSTCANEANRTGDSRVYVHLITERAFTMFYSDRFTEIEKKGNQL